MEPVSVGIVSILAVLLTIGLGIPIGFSISFVALGGLYLIGGPTLMLTSVEGIPYEFASQYGFVVIPMFILMGAFAEISGITKDFYDFFYRLLGKVRGGLLMVTILSSAGFAAISGSTMVNAVVFTRIALPQMLAFGYDKALAAGCIAAAGTFAALIPPSIMMVVYALLTGQSIGALLIAGIVPGILTAAAYLVLVGFIARLKPELAPIPQVQFTVREKLTSFYAVWPFVLLAAIVIGGIYSGAMPPSSAGAVGAVGAFLIMMVRSALTMQPVSRRAVIDSMRSAAVTSASLFLIIIAGLLLSRFFVYSGFVDEIVYTIRDLDIPPYMVMAVIVVMYLVLGCFMDTVSMTVVTVPFVYPIVVNLGYDPIWFGVIMIKLIEIGVLTPPIGLNLFAVISSADGQISTQEMFRGVIPFLVLELAILALLFVFPSIVLWLPTLMVG